MENKELMCALWLSNVKGIGNVWTERLLSFYGSFEEIYQAGEEALRRVLSERLTGNLLQARMEWKLEKEYDKMRELGIKLITRQQEQYPEKLQTIPDAPMFLFLKGCLPRNEEISVAIVGARDCSEYGHFVASELGKVLGGAGIQIISGMARGIDGISQQAALEAGGSSIGVLGCGVDICYPISNQGLYEELIKKGGLLSAYPPGTKPAPGNFPPRNRIVSGLADALIVIEARQKSGTLITVDMALEQGREVYVVPGRITDRLSDGCNKLLKQGAGVVLSPVDFLKELRETLSHGTEVPLSGNSSREKGVQSAAPPKSDGIREKRMEDCSRRSQIDCRQIQETLITDPLLKKIYRALDYYPSDLTILRQKLDADITDIQLTTGLMQLCMQGAAVQITTGFFGLAGH